MICPECDGFTGEFEIGLGETWWRDCWYCHGTGEIEMTWLNRLRGLFRWLSWTWW